MNLQLSLPDSFAVKYFLDSEYTSQSISHKRNLYIRRTDTFICPFPDSHTKITSVSKRSQHRLLVIVSAKRSGAKSAMNISFQRTPAKTIEIAIICAMRRTLRCSRAPSDDAIGHSVFDTARRRRPLHIVVTSLIPRNETDRLRGFSENCRRRSHVR